MNVLEFLEKFNSLSERDKNLFLSYIHGSLSSCVFKEYEVIESAFDSIEKKD